MPKYENSVVYKLCCDDPEITDIYVGSTCNFKVRKTNTKAIVQMKIVNSIIVMCIDSSENTGDGMLGP